MKYSMRSIKIVATLGLATLGMAGSASAISYNGVYSATQKNVAGTSYAVMSSTSSSFCLLSKVGVDNAGAESESPTCQVVSQNGVWVLEASVGTTTDADVSCSARCFNY